MRAGTGSPANLYPQSPAAGSNFMEGVGRPIRIDYPGRPWPLGLIRDHGAIGTMAFFGIDHMIDPGHLEE
jgi:hypothetical protein